jgi:hypothetical protein
MKGSSAANNRLSCQASVVRKITHLRYEGTQHQGLRGAVHPAVSMDCRIGDQQRCQIALCAPSRSCGWRTERQSQQTFSARLALPAMEGGRQFGNFLRIPPRGGDRASTSTSQGESPEIHAGAKANLAATSNPHRSSLKRKTYGWLCVEHRALPITEIDLRGLHIRTRQES